MRLRPVIVCLLVLAMAQAKAGPLPPGYAPSELPNGDLSQGACFWSLPSTIPDRATLIK